jgi:hypothetical protein
MYYPEQVINLRPRLEELPDHLRIVPTGEQVPVWGGIAERFHAIVNGQVIDSALIANEDNYKVFAARAKIKGKYALDCIVPEPLVIDEKRESFMIDIVNNRVITSDQAAEEFRQRQIESARARSNSNFNSYNEQRKQNALQK